MTKKLKQAVILIHGIGEQRPMDALRRFVDAVWTTDKAAHHQFAQAGMFSKPDTVSDSFELRRLTTTQNRNGVRTDFYELYWAHVMEGTSLGHVFGWARRLLWRDPRKLPKPLLPAWFLLVSIIVVAVFLAAQMVVPEDVRVVDLPAWATGLLSVGAAWLIVPVLNTVIGDAARYLDPAPGNVGRRQAIRAAGVDVLKRLHAFGEYDRIVVVGHSLGSVIGYDILTYAWDLYNEKGKTQGGNPALDRIEAYLSNSFFKTSQYRELQRDLQEELRRRCNPWRVTDFVTLGSPLAHAQVLLAKDEADLQRKQADRELPTCPPQLESGRFSYPADHANRTLHHAAVFGPTRWTNLYFPARYLIYGDLIGGPIGPLFGSGVFDRKVTTDLRGGLLSHTLYWTPSKPAPASHILALREALNLIDSA